MLKKELLVFDIIKKHKKLFIKSLAKDISVLFSIIFIFSSAMDIFQLKINFLEKSWYGYCLFIFLVVFISACITLYKCHQTLRICIKIGDNTSISISVDDYIDNSVRYQKSTCIFGCNNSFNLKLVKKDSLQYDFTNKYFKLEEAQAKIDHELLRDAYPPIGTFDEYNKPQYDCGTICCLNFKGKSDIELRKVLLFANSAPRRFNDYNGSGMTGTLIQKVWDFCRDENTVEDCILFPLLGTGHSHDTTPMLSAKSIIDTYFLNYSSHLVNNIIISVHPNHVKNRQIDIVKIIEYIHYKKIEIDFIV